MAWDPTEVSSGQVGDCVQVASFRTEPFGSSLTDLGLEASRTG